MRALMKRLYVLCLIAILGSIVTIDGQDLAYAIDESSSRSAASEVNAKLRLQSTAHFPDIDQHWAYHTIIWAYDNGIVTGYDDGTFKPNRQVTEAEFLVMLLGAYPNILLTDGDPIEPWYQKYFTYAKAQNWPVQEGAKGNRFNRGQVAKIIAATQGKRLDMEAAVQYLLDHQLAQGKTAAATVAGFMPNDQLTRAEALQFIVNLRDKKVQLRSSPAMLTKPFAVKGISIGDTESAMIAKLGQPGRKDMSEYGFTWYIYNQNYDEYAQIGIQDHKVVALYTNSAVLSSSKGITIGTPSREVAKHYGETLTYIQKANTQYTLPYSSKELGMYLIEGVYTTLFYDIHDGQKVTAIQLIDQRVEEALLGVYGKPSEGLRKSYERQVFDLANSVRARFGYKPFSWSEQIAGTARKHSEDMAVKKYFDHTNLKDESPFDRMEADGIPFRSAAENIATGQTNAIYAHESWMNSHGHRVNILGDTERLGVGVYFGGQYHIYYTQNFYTPTK